MKKKILLLLGISIFSSTSAQVGINTDDPQAGLHVKPISTDGSTAEGIIAPNLTRGQLITKDIRYTTAQRGAIVYITAINGTASTKTSKVTRVGYYYFDGVEWQPFAANANNGLTMDAETVQLGGALTKTTTINKGTNVLNLTGTGAFNVAGNTTLSNNLLVGGKAGVGNTSPNANLDIRPNPTSTSNPGSSFLGIGTTTVSAASAGSGAIRYSTSSGGALEYSNGVVWSTLTSTVKKSIVVARKTTPQTFAPGAYATVTGWVKQTDTNGNFNASTGIFVAPRDGNYSVSFSYAFTSGPISAGSQVESAIRGSVNLKSITGYPTAGTAVVGTAISFVVKLQAGNQIYPAIYHNMSTSKVLRVLAQDAASDGFVNLSIVEL